MQGTELCGWGAAEVARLNEARLSALEDRCDAELRLGGHPSAAEELEHLLALHPSRERLAGLLMLAHYRCGRHTEALTCYARLREHLAEVLGVDPSPQLQRLHTAMRTGWPTGTQTARSSSTSTGTTRRPRSTRPTSSATRCSGWACQPTAYRAT